MEKRVWIEKIVNRGMGLGYDQEAKIVFVPYTAVGDEVIVEITKSKKRYDIGQIKKFIKKSEERIEPNCSFFTKCGGCHFLHIPYEKELEYKKLIVENIIKREVNNVIPSIEFNYRNKATFHADYRSSRLKLGFYMASSNRVINIDKCPLLINTINYTKNIIESLNIPHLDRVVIRTSHDGKKLLVNLIGEKKHKDYIKKIIKTQYNIIFDHIIRNYASEKGVSEDKYMEFYNDFNLVFYFNSKPIDEKKSTIKTEFLNKKFFLTSNDFFQTNYYIGEKMFSFIYNFVKDNIEYKKLLIDGYSGSLTIGIILSELFEEVIGIEQNPSNIFLAEKNIKENNINNAKIIQKDFRDYIKQLSFKQSKGNILVLDPPREGVGKDIKYLDRYPLDYIIYISCDPMTSYRDINYLQNYKIEKVLIFDMFPRTFHIEVLYILKRII